MSTAPRKNRNAFRPVVGDFPLEERVVLNGSTLSAGMMRVQVSTMPNGGGSSTAPTELGGSSNRLNFNTSRLQNNQSLAALRQLRNTFRQQFTDAQNALRQFVSTQADSLFDPANLDANGRLLPVAITNFQNSLGGALNASALRLSAQSSLLPGSAERLVPLIQNSLLGSGRSSLESRIGQLLNSSRFTRSSADLQNALSRQIGRAFSQNSARMSSFLASPAVNRLSIDPTTGQRIPLSQFMNNQALQQINNSFGALVNNVGPLAQSTLFDSAGVFNPQAVTGFQQQFANALGTVGTQIGGITSLFPNGSSLASQLQSTLFGTGIDPITGQPVTSLFNSLVNAIPTSTGGSNPFTPGLFNTNFQNGFTNAFQNFSSPLNTFFGAQNSGGPFQLPSGFFQSNATFPNIFGSQFAGSSFNNGFNNGFLQSGSGFPGFGTVPSGFNTQFGTGFNNLVGSMNQQFGFTPPSFGTGTGGVGGVGGVGGIGGVGGVGTGVGGVGTGTGGIGGVGTGVGTGVGGVGTGTGVGGIGGMGAGGLV